MTKMGIVQSVTLIKYVRITLYSFIQVQHSIAFHMFNRSLHARGRYEKYVKKKKEELTGYCNPKGEIKKN